MRCLYNHHLLRQITNIADKRLIDASMQTSDGEDVAVNSLQHNKFKSEFKYWKSKQPLPDFANVVDVNSICCRTRFFDVASVDDSFANKLEKLGLNSVDKWCAFESLSYPGFLLVQNVLSTDGQLYWAERCLKDFPQPPNVTNIDSTIENRSQHCIFEHRESLKKLRWVTLGYHHNWKTKKYSEESKSAMPDDLYQLCEIVSNIIGHANFGADAAIVHYYHLDSTLSGHVDRSEDNLTAPLLAFSIGQSAIFLIGGETLEEKPSAFWLRSGDLTVMSGLSRTCYHAIPRVVQDCKFNSRANVDSRILNYLKHNRININVRQHRSTENIP